MTDEQLMYIVREVTMDIARIEANSIISIDAKRRTCIGMTVDVHRELTAAAEARGLIFGPPKSATYTTLAGYQVKIIDPGRMAPGIWIMREIEIPFDITGENAPDCDDDCEHCEYATCPKEEAKDEQ